MALMPTLYSHVFAVYFIISVSLIESMDLSYLSSDLFTLMHPFIPT